MSDQKSIFSHLAPEHLYVNTFLVYRGKFCFACGDRRMSLKANFTSALFQELDSIRRGSVTLKRLVFEKRRDSSAKFIPKCSAGRNLVILPNENSIPQNLHKTGQERGDEYGDLAGLALVQMVYCIPTRQGKV